MLNWFKKKEIEPKKIGSDDRIHEIELDVKHIKQRIDAIAFYLQKIEKDGLKVRAVK